MSDGARVRATELLRILRRRAGKLSVPHDEIAGAGSHLKVRHGGRATVIPMHRGDLPAGTFRAILKQLGLTEQDLEV